MLYRIRPMRRTALPRRKKGLKLEPCGRYGSGMERRYIDKGTDDITTRDEITADEIFMRLRADMLKAIFVNM